MTRLVRLFPVAYEQSRDGLVLAEHELDRLTALHAAYASQPDITAIWQGYIDEKARSVATHSLVVDRLRAGARDQLHATADAADARGLDASRRAFSAPEVDVVPCDTASPAGLDG